MPSRIKRVRDFGKHWYKMPSVTLFWIPRLIIEFSNFPSLTDSKILSQLTLSVSIEVVAMNRILMHT